MSTIDCSITHGLVLEITPGQYVFAPPPTTTTGGEISNYTTNAFSSPELIGTCGRPASRLAHESETR